MTLHPISAANNGHVLPQLTEFAKGKNCQRAFTLPGHMEKIGAEEPTKIGAEEPALLAIQT